MEPSGWRTEPNRALYNVLRRADAETDRYRGLFGVAGWICTDPAALEQVMNSGFRRSDNCGGSAA